MTTMRNLLLGFGFLAVGVSAAPAQTPMAGVRELYASASYDEALKVLAQIDGGADSATVIEAEQYRALCLLAVGRPAEANDAVRRIVEQDPLYVPAGEEVSPRIAAVFAEARRELLPTIARKQFAEAKTLFTRQEHQRASELLDRIVQITADPVLKEVAGLEDLRLIADGLLILARTKAASPPPSSPAPAQAPATQHEPTPLSAARPIIYSSNNKDVTVPEAISQPLPLWHPPGNLRNGIVLSGLLRVIVAEDGSVEEVTVLRGAHPLYDATLRKTAYGWTFRPALKDGQPVKYAKVIQFQLRD